MIKHSKKTLIDQSRINWIDIYKGIMISLVVIGHATGKFNAWIYQFHMAAFFFCSGFLSNIEKKGNISSIVKKALSILLPYFSLGIVGILINSVLNIVGIHEILFGNAFEGLWNSIKQLLLYGNSTVQYWGTFWFLSTLFGVEVMQFLICRLNKNEADLRYFVFSLILFLLGYWLIKNNIKPHIWIIDLDLVFIAQLYFTAGVFCRKSDIVRSEVTRKGGGCLIIFVICFFIAFWGKQNGIVVDYPSRSFRYPFAECIVALGSITIIICISHFIDKYLYKLKSILTFCGKNSLGIMTLHFLFFKIFFVILYKADGLSIDEVKNIVMKDTVSLHYWFPLTIWTITGSLVFWNLAKKIPGISFLLGQDIKNNKLISEKITSIKFIKKFEKKPTDNLTVFWTNLNRFVYGHKTFSCFACIFILLFAIPMYRIGIIINDELQARCLAMQGGLTFYKTEFAIWMNQGRLLAAPINSFTKYLSFIGAEYGTVFRIFSILILYTITISFGIFIYKLFKDKAFAAFTSIFALACMPVAFEHTLPNAFVSFLGIPFIFIFVALILYIDYIKNFKRRKAVISMIFFFVSMMSYEAFITFTILFFMVTFGITGFEKEKKNIKLYLIPFATALFYLICYVICGKIFPSSYPGNQLGFDNIIEPLQILLNLFMVCIPGFYVFFPRYQYYTRFYFNLETNDYFRIFLFGIAFWGISSILLNKLVYMKNDDNAKGEIKKKIYIVICGLCYMILPSLPIAVSRMYQGKVGLKNGFLTLPVTFFEYFAAVFLMSYSVLLICQFVQNKYYLIMVSLVSLLVINIQQMNDIFSKIHNSNFSRLTAIESFLQTDTVKNLTAGEYVAKDFYKQQNSLSIHSNYWTTYINSVLELPLQITDMDSKTKLGTMFYDDDNFVIVTAQQIVVLSLDKEDKPKAVPLSDGSFILYNFTDEHIDGKFYVYSMENDNALFPGYCLNYGLHSDSWLEQKSSFTVTTGKAGNVYLGLTYPGMEYSGKTIRILKNGNCIDTLELEADMLELTLGGTPYETFDLDIECNFVYENKGADAREISILLSYMNVE